MSNILIIIEWKYAEAYSDENKAIGSKGKIRAQRYNDIINKSCQLSLSSTDVFYCEPFYQLMRQTIWAEQMIRNKISEIVKADDFIHIHVIPPKNDTLLKKIYRCDGQGNKDMEDTWRACLKDQKKYRIVSPRELLSPIEDSKYYDLFHYLQTRYW